jgi:hypothetical protein
MNNAADNSELYNETKTIYELSKVTSISKQILDDFNSAVVMAIFKEYVGSYNKPRLALNSFMHSWEENILSQKQIELDILLSQESSMEDMVLGQVLANAEDLALYKEEVTAIKALVTDSIVAAFDADGNFDDEDDE